MGRRVRNARGIGTATGFTLMEMLIVIAIIAVLVAIAIPVFTSSLQNAREKTDLENAKSMTSALEAYYITATGKDALLAEGTGFDDRGWIYVDKDGIRCNGNADKALEEAGLLTSTTSSSFKSGNKTYPQASSNQIKCQATSRWVKYQINFHKGDDGYLVFTYSASKKSGSGTSSANDNKQATSDFVSSGIGTGEPIEMG